MLRGIFGRGNVATADAVFSVDVESTTKALESAMKASLKIMNDDLDGAEAALGETQSPFHQLGRGMVAFIQAAIGLEQEHIRKASQLLAEAEICATSAQSQVVKATSAFKSEIYPPGTEFALCHAEGQLMAAVTGVLSGSWSECIASFYKLRRAYLTFQSISNAEFAFVKRRKNGKSQSQPGKNANSQTQTQSSSVSDAARPKADDPDHMNGGSDASERSRWGSTMLLDDADSEAFNSPIDVFIHTGTCLCFGILLVVLSLIPPTFAKFLWVVGFQGNKERGLRLLWQATKFENMHGALAGILLLGYYNAFVGFSDIIYDTPIWSNDPADGYPRKRCVDLLVTMRSRHPVSQLWLLEESRMLALDKKLDKAVTTLTDSSPAPLKQIEFLKFFELGLDSMFSHRFQLCADSFITSLSTNDWSHALYYYVAGASLVELYRDMDNHDTDEAKKVATLAEDYLHRAAANIGKTKFLARPLPFDAFVGRKLKKWRARSEHWAVSFIDAVGVCPIEEMIMFWGGYKRMNKEHLEESLRRLDNHMQGRLWEKEEADERAIASILRAATLRCLGRYDEARDLLNTNVININPTELKGGFRDDWVVPVAQYEMGATFWYENQNDSKDSQGEDVLIKQCQFWINKASKGGPHELDDHIGMRVTGAQDTLKLWFDRKEHRKK